MSRTPAVLPAGLLEDKVTIITGASQGIGKVAARMFAGAGAKVVLSARRGAIVEGLAKDIREAGGEALGLACDVTREDQVRSMVEEALRTFGRLDCALNNAGLDPTTIGRLHEIPTEEFEAIHAVKIRGTFLSMKHEIPAMIAAGGGSIVNQGSVVGVRAPATYPAASSSQSAMTGLTRSAAAAYGQDNIRVNLLETGLINTEERAVGMYEGMEEFIRSHAPAGRGGTSEDVAAQAAWLLSDWSSFVTGISLPVDGGHITTSI
jgi:A-factor type gamma-butyrolactone 1'-reductase (1S-forming)